MSDWWTYDLADLILFSSHTYYRLIELYNLAIWPFHLLAILFAAALLYLTVKRPPHHGKITAIILATSWLWVAWAFHWQRFAVIHWVASYYAIVFVAQAILLVWLGLLKDQLRLQPVTTASQKLALSIVLYALLMHPFIMLPFGHHWKQAELFTVTPDTTVLATIGLILLSNQKSNKWLLVIPLAWCAVSGTTLYILQSFSAAGLILTLLAALTVLLLRKFQPAETQQGR